MASWEMVSGSTITPLLRLVRSLKRSMLGTKSLGHVLERQVGLLRSECRTKPRMSNISHRDAHLRSSSIRASPWGRLIQSVDGAGGAFHREIWYVSSTADCSPATNSQVAHIFL